MFGLIFVMGDRPWKNLVPLMWSWSLRLTERPKLISSIKIWHYDTTVLKED